MRLAGLASGLDIDSMVKELMKARRTSFDNLVKKRTSVEWQQEDYRTMSTKIVDFRNNKLSAFNLSNSISAKTSEVSGETSTLTVNSTSAAAAGTLNVKVTEVATAANTIYTFDNKQADGVTEKTLEELGFKADLSTSGNVFITVNGVKISTSKDGTLSDLANAINAKSSSANATALYDSKTGQFSFAATKTGATNVSGTSYTGLTIADIDDAASLAANITAKDATNTGKDAKVLVNGITYEQASNRFVLNGFDFTVKAKSVSTTGTMIAAVQDTTKIIDTIKSFVSEYNAVISSINSELSEAKYRTYKPLTSDEKEEMTEDEIKLWESKARSGTLRNDSTLSKYVSELRTAATFLVAGITDPSTGEKISIGITTGTYTEKGKLILDENKLRNALESNPNEVIALFTAKSSDTSPGSTTSGVFAKMSESSMTALTSLSKLAGTSLTSTETTGSFLEDSSISMQLREMRRREDRLQDRLNAAETQYYKQFSAMETAINKFNSQSSSLSSFL